MYLVVETASFERAGRLLAVDVRDGGRLHAGHSFYLVDQVRPEQARADNADPDRCVEFHQS
ncbi:hypothetical protein BRC68_15085 [Halobacteriales archaeon QH_6_64_20]|nr:MAG: hypothetical protein BRC68_15085 [Halobacteriales archaeon QH_6_64_20]